MLGRTIRQAVLATLIATTCAVGNGGPGRIRPSGDATGEVVPLPPPAPLPVTLDAALHDRRSIRFYSTAPVTLAEVGKLCWAAQGVTDSTNGLRTAPSAGALYPLEVYVVLPSGTFHYEPRSNQLRRRDSVDRRSTLSHAALDQEPIALAGADIVLTAVVARTRVKYGDRAERFAAMEAGHAAQNVLLEATALGLGAVPIGGFIDDDVRRAIGVGGDELPLYVIAVGHR